MVKPVQLFDWSFIICIFFWNDKLSACIWFFKSNADLVFESNFRQAELEDLRSRLFFHAYDVERALLRVVSEHELILCDIPVTDWLFQWLFKNHLSALLPDLNQVLLPVAHRAYLRVYDFKKDTYVGRALRVVAASHDLVKWPKWNLLVNRLQVSACIGAACDLSTQVPHSVFINAFFKTCSVRFFWGAIPSAWILIIASVLFSWTDLLWAAVLGRTFRGSVHRACRVWILVWVSDDFDVANTDPGTVRHEHQLNLPVSFWLL